MTVTPTQNPQHASPLARLTVWLALFLLVCSTSARAATPAGWATDLDQALQTAKTGNKLVLIMFSATWCPPCKTMQADVFPKDDVKQILTADWVPVYIDEAQNQELIKRFKVQAFPTFVSLSTAGEELDRFVGGRSAEEFVRRLGEVQARADRLTAISREVKANPNDPVTLQRYGDALSEMGRVEEALDQYRKAKQLDTNNATGVDADIYFFETLRAGDKDPKAAQERLERIPELYPNSPRVGDSLFVRGLIRLQSQDRAGGRKLLEEYRQKYPDGRFAGPASSIIANLDAEKTGGAGATSPTPGQSGQSGQQPPSASPAQPDAQNYSPPPVDQQGKAGAEAD